MDEWKRGEISLKEALRRMDAHEEGNVFSVFKNGFVVSNIDRFIPLT